MASNRPPTGDKALGLEDLGAVLSELFLVRGKWYNIGLQLLVPVTELQKIESEYKNDHSTCLRQMLIKWLESGKGSWESLCKALESPMVKGEDNTLVMKLKEKYCKEEEKKAKKRKASEPPIHCAPAKKHKEGLIPERLEPADFKTPPPDERRCVKCRSVPHNPQRSECCQTIYCLPCSSYQVYCYQHKTGHNFSTDKAMKKSITTRGIKCPNWRLGCSFEDNVSKVYKQHLPDCGKAIGSLGVGAQKTSDRTTTSSHPKESTANIKGATNVTKGDANITKGAGITIKGATVSSTVVAKQEPPPTQNKICCIYAKQGCTWSGDLGSLSQHIQECKISNVGKSSTVKTEKPPPTTSTVKKVVSSTWKPPPSQPTVTKHSSTPVSQAQTQPTSVKKLLSQTTLKQTPVPASTKPAVVANPPRQPLPSQGTALVQQGPPASPSKQPKLMVQCVYANRGCQWTGELKLLPTHVEDCDKGKPAASSVPPPQPNPTSSPARWTSADSAPSQSSKLAPAEAFTKIKVEKAQLQSWNQQQGQKSQTFGDLARGQLRPSEVKPCPCKYQAAIGCPHAVPPDQMYQHLRDNMQLHLDLAIAKIAELQKVLGKEA